MRRLVVALGLLVSVFAGSAAADYLGQYNLSKDATFLKRVEVGIVDAAVDIANEPPSTPNYLLRIRLAQRVLANPPEAAKYLAVGIVADPAITSGSTDAQIKTRIAAIWNAYAGAR